MNVLHQLLHIKTFRERKALNEMRRCARALDEATGRLETEQAGMAIRRRESAEREQALYGDLFSRQVVKADIEEVKRQVVELHEALAAGEKQLADVAAARRTALTAWQDATAAHRQAVRLREKFEEIVELCDAEEIAELQRCEDLELEEVRRAGTPTGPLDGGEAA